MEGEIEDRRKEDASTKFEERVMEEFITKAGRKATKRNKWKVINTSTVTMKNIILRIT